MRPVNLTSYSDFADLFNTCRSISKGKPLPGGWRMHQHNRLYAVYISNIKIFEIDRNNKLTFTVSQRELLNLNHSLVTVLYKIIPLMLSRKRKGVYVISKIQAYHPPLYRYLNVDHTNTLEYFTGMQFDLATQTCLNPRPNLLDTVIPKVRKQWLRDVKRFKRGLKARAKVGALQGYIQEVVEDTGYIRNLHPIPQWDSPEITQQVLECMRTDKYPPNLLRLLVQTVNLGWRQTHITDSMVLENVDTVFNTHSVHYRKAYGVFDTPT